METLFRPGTNTAADSQFIIQHGAGTPSPALMHSSYVLNAIIALKEHIDDNPFKFKTAAALLENLNAPNRNSVEKAFKDLYGTRIKEYQVKQRLAQAKNYLQKGVSKKLVATKCMYGSSSAFCTAFRKEFGITPSQWERISRQSTIVGITKT
jgi:AraC-like DNA-binding protein